MAFAMRLLVQVNIVHAHYFPPENVNHLLVQQVARQQKHSLLRIRARPLALRRPRPYPAIERHDELSRQQPAAR